MDAETLVQAQTGLRTKLLDRHGALNHRSSRDLAGQMLLYLDEPKACWRIGAEWLCDVLHARAVIAGFDNGSGSPYVPLVDVQPGDGASPSVLDVHFVADDLTLSHHWYDSGPVVYDDIAVHPGVAGDVRQRLLDRGSHSKMGLPVFDRGHLIGLLWAEWSDRRAGTRWLTTEQWHELSNHVIGPIVAEARRLSWQRDDEAAPGAASDLLASLTRAELRLAQLIADGLSYKEAARRLGRSFSTVDHQLRSIRRKLDVPSTARLVGLLSRCLAGHSPAAPDPHTALR